MATGRCPPPRGGSGGRADVYGAPRLRRALAHFVGGRLLQGAAQAVLVLLLVRVLALADFGMYMVLIGVAETMLAVASFGTFQIGRRFVPPLLVSVAGPALRRLVGTLLAIQALALLAVAGAAAAAWSAIAATLGVATPTAGVAGPAICLLVLIPALNFTCELLDALLEQGRSRLVVTLLGLGRIAGVSGLVALIGRPLGLHDVLRLDAALLGGALVLAQALLWHSLWRLPDPSATGTVPWRAIRRFGVQMIPVDLLGACASPGAVRAVVAAALGAADGGLFAFLQTLQRLAGRFLPGTLLRGLAMPMLIVRAEGPSGPGLTARAANLLMKSNLLVVGAGAVVIAVAGDPLVALLSGGRFVSAGGLLLLLYLGLAVTGQRAVLEMVMQVRGQGGILAAAGLLAPATLVAVWAVAPGGIHWSILALIGGSVAANGLVAFILVRSTGGFRFDWGGGLRIAVAAALALVPAKLLAAAGVPTPVGAVSALVGFLLFLPVVRPFRAGEARLVGRALGEEGVVTGVVRRLARHEGSAPGAAPAPLGERPAP